MQMDIEKIVQIANMVITILGVIAAVAVPLLIAFGKTAAAEKVHAFADALGQATPLLKQAVSAAPHSNIQKDIFEKVGDVVSSNSKLTKAEAITRVEQVINKGGLSEKGVYVSLDGGAKVVVDGGEASKKVYRKIRAWRDKFIFSKIF
jgi:type II secretory pathway pseudopilin PulG